MLGQRPMTILAHAERHMDPGTTCERLDLCQQLSGNWEHRIHTPLVHGGSTTSEYPPMQGHQCKLGSLGVGNCAGTLGTSSLFFAAAGVLSVQAGAHAESGNLHLRSHLTKPRKSTRDTEENIHTGPSTLRFCFTFREPWLESNTRRNKPFSCWG